MMRPFAVLTLLAVAGPLSSQELRQEIEAYVDAHQKPIVTELWQALSLKAVARDRESSRKKGELLARALS